nr:TnsA endonuclease N-terminal domain-containing protein [uncultured Pseudogulbenkiania sp.]
MLIPSVRKIHNHNSHKVIGFSFSYKMNGLIPWESTLERDWLLHLEATPSIRAIYSQPDTFDYCHEGKWHRYTPDFKAIWYDCNRPPTLYEVKPDEVTSDNNFKATANAIGLQLTTLGYEYIIVDNKLIRSGNQLTNLNFLKHYVDAFVTQRDRQRIADYLFQVTACRLAWLAIRFGNNDLTLAGLYRLLWEGWLEYDKREKVNPLLTVRLAEGARI